MPLFFSWSEKAWEAETGSPEHPDCGRCEHSAWQFCYCNIVCNSESVFGHSLCLVSEIGDSVLKLRIAQLLSAV